MIHIVNNENRGVIRCRVVYVDTEWATLNWNVFKFVDELQRAGCQQIRKGKMFPSPAGTSDQDLHPAEQGFALA